MILLVDNYDSFVHNLARYVRRLGHEAVVVRNDEITTPQIRSSAARAVILSPGPCTPAEAGNSLQIVSDLAFELPMLGVCLGHQTIAAAFGAAVIRAKRPVHGQTSRIQHNGRGLFRGLPNPLTVARYHSLAVDESTLPDELQPTAWAEDGTLMALQHRQYPVTGWQFHPESILTEHGYALLSAFFRQAKLSSEAAPVTMSTERRQPLPYSGSWPDRPVTF